MRLNEITFESNDKILDEGKKYFDIAGTTEVRQGKLDIKGNCRVKVDVQSLNDIPIKLFAVSNTFFCGDNVLTTLDGSLPEATNFICFSNKLTSLVGAPKIINRLFNCIDNPLESLDGIPKEIWGTIQLTYHPDLPLLRLLFVKGLNNIFFRTETINIGTTNTNLDVSAILYRYFGQGRKGALLCAAELTRAGYKGNARL